jgi:hypothetical protein
MPIYKAHEPQRSAVKPLGMTVLGAACLLGSSKPSIYRRIRQGALPLLPIEGARWRVSVAGLEKIAGRELSLDEIQSAETAASEVRAANLAKKRARARS